MHTRWTPCLLLLALGACATPKVETAAPVQPCVQEGLASYYAARFAHKRTADGETLDPAALTAAHPSLPFGTEVRVTDLDTARSVVVRITDRGPVARNRIIDLSPAAAKALDMRSEGVAHVRLELDTVVAAASPAVAATAEACLLDHPVTS